MTPIETKLKELEKLDKAATHGSWNLKHISGSNFAVQEFQFRSAGSYPIFQIDDSAIDCGSVFCSPEDANLIAAYRNETPKLIAALREAVDEFQMILCTHYNPEHIAHRALTRIEKILGDQK